MSGVIVCTFSQPGFGNSEYAGMQAMIITKRWKKNEEMQAGKVTDPNKITNGEMIQEKKQMSITASSRLSNPIAYDR